jgi:hypothetical protein
MAGQSPVHLRVDVTDASGVGAKERRCHGNNTSSCALKLSIKIREDNRKKAVVIDVRRKGSKSQKNVVGLEIPAGIIGR